MTCSKIERFQSNENIVLDIAKVPTVRNREKYTKLVFIQKVSQSCIGKKMEWEQNEKQNNFYPFDQPKKHQLFFLTPEHNHFRIDFHG